MPVYLFLQYFYSIPMLWFPFKLQTSNLLVMSTACSTDWKDYISLQIYTNTVIITSMALKIQNTKCSSANNYYHLHGSQSKQNTCSHQRPSPLSPQGPHCCACSQSTVPQCPPLSRCSGSPPTGSWRLVLLTQ